MKGTKQKLTEVRRKLTFDRRDRDKEKATRVELSEKVKKQETKIEILERLVRPDSSASNGIVVPVASTPSRTPETTRATSTPTAVDPMDQLELQKLRKQVDFQESVNAETTALRQINAELKQELDSKVGAFEEKLAQQAAALSIAQAELERLRGWKDRIRAQACND